MNEGKIDVISEPVMSEASFTAFLLDNGYVHRVRGTYYSETNQTFLYCKRKALFDSKEAGTAAMLVYKSLTERGVLHPDTNWKLYQKDNGLFQVFAVSPKLSQAWDDLTDARLTTDPVEKYDLLVNRLPEDAEETGLLDHLDPMEVQCRSNWGYDPDLGEFYVVDVEAVMFDGDEAFKQSNQAAVETETPPIETPIMKW